MPDSENSRAALPGTLTDDEQTCLEHLCSAAGLFKKIIGNSDQAEHDWSEAAMRIHALQHMVMAQSAARAYPHRYRLLGGWPSD